jgi:hypothetical protein
MSIPLSAHATNDNIANTKDIFIKNLFMIFNLLFKKGTTFTRFSNQGKEGGSTLVPHFKSALPEV